MTVNEVCCWWRSLIQARELSRVISDGSFSPTFPDATAGTGLGLAIVQRIVLEHRVDSSETNHPLGARFVIELPAGT